MKLEIDVVGGVYGETCAFPRRNMLRGSGGRAAAVLAGLRAHPRLHTALTTSRDNIFRPDAAALGIELLVTPSTTDGWFHYRHPLSSPMIDPQHIPPVTWTKAITADAVLLFGMLEGRPVVHANRVVYDPQDGRRSRPFAENGSTAQQLALVLSHSEAFALSGEDDPEKAAAKLISDPGINVVVVKCGPRGALVAEKQNAHWVAAFPSIGVWKVGSGDVFSAAFAWQWMLNEASPQDAAWFASRMVAQYVEFEADQFDEATYSDIIAAAKTAATQPPWSPPNLASLKPIYLAAPFFTTAQQWLVDELRIALLDAGFPVFSPIHDVGPMKGRSREVAERDLEGLRNSSVLFAVLDGGDPGTLFEVGYARDRNIPVIALAENVPTAALTMIEGTGCWVTSQLASAFYRACWTALGHV